ncbi:TPA: hypothetical protein RXM66_001841 [Campylobacter jejuni]|nr:hypothetical protein [Campylobacter jejuni]
MIILKNLYIIWIIIWGFGAILGYYMGYDATFTKMFFFLVILYLFPLLPYFYYLIYKKARNTKNIFIAIYCYLLLLLINRNNSNFELYLIIIVIHIIIFAIIYLIKRNKNENSNQ